MGLAQHESMSSIARRLKFSPSTITREVKANGGPKNYSIWPAHQRAEQATKRPKVSKLDNPLLRSKVTKWLEQLWSPQEISGRLKLDFEGDPSMQVSHETIYQSLFVQGRGELRRELTRYLRSGRAKRIPNGQTKKSGPIANMVMISYRHLK